MSKSGPGASSEPSRDLGGLGPAESLGALPDLAELRRLAEAATPGPWAIEPDCYDGNEEMWCAWHRLGPFVLAGANPRADSLYVAAAHPQAVLALLAENERLRAALLRLRDGACTCSCHTGGGYCEECCQSDHMLATIAAALAPADDAPGPS